MKTRIARRVWWLVALLGAALVALVACEPVKQPVKEPPPTAPPPPALSISPTEHDFGSDTADGGSSNYLLFYVTNNGSTAAQNFTIGLQGGDPSQFDLVRPSVPPGPDGPCVYLAKLDPSQTCFQQVFFIPSKAGPAVTDLVATGDPGGTVRAALKGNGTALFVEPSASGVTFADETADGTSTNSVVVTVTNNGPDTTSLVVGLQGGDPSQFDLYRSSPAGDCVYLAQLGPGESCTQTVLFNPTKTGFASTTLVATGIPGGTDTHSLHGNGVP